jgi:hypothetical protein
MVVGLVGNRRFVWFGRPRRPKKTFQKVGSEDPHLLEWFLGAAGAAQTPKNVDFRPAQKPCMINPSVHLDVLTFI